MTHIPDLSSVSYMGLSGPIHAIGWLEASDHFNHGLVEPEFSSKLLSLLKKPMSGLFTLGMHFCSLCTAEGKIGPDNRTSQNVLLVPTQHLVYEAPIWIGHYVLQHSYLPPIEFRKAVMDCPEAGSEELRLALIKHIPELSHWSYDEMFWDWDVQSTLTPDPENGDEMKFLAWEKRLRAEAEPQKSREEVIGSHGGYSKQTCLWAGCDNKALAGMAICFDHTYPDFGKQGY